MSILKLFGIDENSIIGTVGESRTAMKLGWMKLFGKEGIVLRNVYIPKENGETSEIDLLYITQKGIIVMESKNYSGYIFGNDNNPKWTVTLYAGKDWIGRKKVEKHQFYNPIWQNKTHIKYLKEYLGEDIQTISLIVFSERCELKNVSYNIQDTIVCQRDVLLHVINKIWRNYPDVLDADKIEMISTKLSLLTGVDKEVKEKHIENIKERINNNDACPRCGGKLVIRTAKSGPNTGKQFYGCSNYPKCKFTKDCSN